MTQLTDKDGQGYLVSCPIPLTHSRLRHAHLLWHQALQNYHNSEAFRANLNATIEALRNVTFVLQNEKRVFLDFDKWYGRWQELLKADATAKWLNEARVTVVHQGDLDSYSFAEVRLETYSQQVLFKLEIPVQTPAQLVLENPSLVQLLANADDNRPDLGDAVILIERRWSAKDLDGREILSTLAHVYGFLADMVLDAHSHLERLECIPINAEHAEFPVSSDRTGMLRCMTGGAELRTQRFSIDSRRELVPSSETVSVETSSAEVLTRYGISIAELNADGDITHMDSLAFANRILYFAKRVLRRDKNHIRLMFLRDGKGTWHQHSIIARNKTEKFVLMQMAGSFVEQHGCDTVIEVGEVWTNLYPINAGHLKVTALEKHSERGEALSVVVATRDGLLQNYVTPITRGRLGGIKLGATEESQKIFPGDLRPIFEVWRKSRMFRTQMGTDSIVWQPDILDLCPCGGSKRFGECCRSQLTSFKAATVSDDFAQAMKSHNLELAERLARAHLAQYVVWIKQHTVPTVHTREEFFRKIAEIDALALHSLIDRMIGVLVVAGKSDFVLSQLQRLEELVGVPRLAMRVAALTAQWLFALGRPEEAVLELQRLGAPEKFSDALAISLAIEHFDLSYKRKKKLFATAISVSASEEERHSVSLEFAEFLSRNGETEKSLELIGAVLRSTSSTGPKLRSAALILRWNVTKREADFEPALAEMEKASNAEHRIQNGIYLIDNAKYEDAERLLAPLICSGDVTAKLIVADGRLRIGERAAARSIFDSIAIEEVPVSSLYPYAHMMALLVCAGGFDDLREQAVQLLSELPSTGGEQDQEVKRMLALLREK
jgi:hypothetical protein